jgi:hypothetical protein
MDAMEPVNAMEEELFLPLDNDTFSEYYHYQQQQQQSTATDDSLLFPECGGAMSDHYWHVWSLFVYWCEGVLMVPIGLVGILGNIFSMIVLSSK